MIKERIMSFAAHELPTFTLKASICKTYSSSLIPGREPSNSWPTSCETPLESVADPGAVWGNFPPKRLWRPADKNAPLFGAYRSRNKNKKSTVETKQCFALR